MVKDERCECIGFVFPLKAAIDYRNLLADRVPGYKRLIASQTQQVDDFTLQVADKDREIAQLQVSLSQTQEKFKIQGDLLSKYEQNQMSAKRWRALSGVLAGSTAVLTLLVLAN